jgi:predicted nucleotidyltransferase
MLAIEPRSKYLYPGKNGIETSVAIMDVLSGFSRGRKMLEHDKVKEIFRRLNEGGVRYALIGGLAYSQYAPPRATQDVDLVVLAEDVSKVRQLFPGCYRRGTAIAGIYNFEGTYFDVQPAHLRAQVATVMNAVDDTYEGEPVKVAAVRDLILLKVWAAAERREVGKKLQDQTDVVRLLEYNADRISADDIAYIARSLLAMGYTAEAAAKYRQSLVWLNQTLDELEMSDRKYPLE